jgi:uncharacterized protein YciI
MYALALIRYRRPIDEVIAHQSEHRAYLSALKSQGLLVASGPLDPRYGGALLLSLPEGATAADLDAVRDGDPYYRAGVAQYELLFWNVGTGKDDLDRALTIPEAASEEDEPPTSSREGEVAVLRQFDSAIEAEVARTALEAAGLYAVVWDEDTQLGPVTQGVRLVVRETDRQVADDILAQAASAQPAEDEK